MTIRRVTLAQLRKLRLASQLISRSDFTRPAEVVRHMTALQAQDFNAAKWAIGLRCPSSTNEAVERAIASGQIVRTWPMRGTLHFLAAEDLFWISSLTSSRVLRMAKTRLAARGLTNAVIARARTAAVRALEGGRCLTRDAMHDVFRKAKIDPENERGYLLLWTLSHHRIVCFGPPSGASQTFVLASEWIKKSRVLDREQALGELALRYMRSRGPATQRDFSFWSGVTGADATLGVSVARSKLAEIEVDNAPYFLDPKLLATKLGDDDDLHALPSFDEFLLGYRDRSAVVARDEWRRIVPGNGVFSAVLVRNGTVVGTWKRVLEKNSVLAQARPFTALAPRERARFAEAMRAYGRFLRMPIAIET